MLKHALNYWGIKNTDDLDPAVKLILEALSTELYNLGNEIKNCSFRMRGPSVVWLVLDVC